MKIFFKDNLSLENIFFVILGTIHFYGSSPCLCIHWHTKVTKCIICLFLLISAVPRIYLSQEVPVLVIQAILYLTSIKFSVLIIYDIQNINQIGSLKFEPLFLVSSYCISNSFELDFNSILNYTLLCSYRFSCT